MTSIITNKFALHFGIYPSPTGALSVDGHTEANVEHEIDLSFGGTAGPVPQGLRAFVSGSWACWGHHDQSEYDAEGRLLAQSEGDRSLHVVFFMPESSDPLTAERVLMVWDVLRIALEGRLLDHAVMTDADDWSQQQGVVLFRGNPFVSILSTNEQVGAVARNDMEDVIDEDAHELDRVLNGEAAVRGLFTGRA